MSMHLYASECMGIGAIGKHIERTYLGYLIKIHNTLLIYEILY